MTALPGPTAVIGAGSWGTALALLLARCQQDTLLWSGEPGHAQAMAKSQSNEAYLPGIPLEPRITPSDNFEAIGAVRRGWTDGCPHAATRGFCPPFRFPSCTSSKQGPNLISFRSPSG